MKKNLLFNLAITLLFSISAWAQTGTTSLTLTVGDKINPMSLQDVAGPIEIPVYLVFDEDVNVGSFEFIIDFDDNVLTFDGHTAGSGVPAAGSMLSDTPSSGNLRVSWGSTTSITNISLTDDDILVTLEFTAVVGDSQLDFVNPNITPGGSAFFEGDDDETGQISTTFNDGFITISPAVSLSMWAFFLTAGLIIIFLAFRTVRLF